MSGEPIVLAGAEDGNAARLVRSTARLGEAHLGPHALIGGLAVMCRLAAVHRATQDVDTVIETTAPTAVQVIASSIGTLDPHYRWPQRWIGPPFLFGMIIWACFLVLLFLLIVISGALGMNLG